MSEHFSTGVKIILARIESHPEEFKQPFGKWDDIMNSVRTYMAGEKNHAYGMTEEEIEALHEKFREHIWTPQFNDMVMQRVLDPDREDRLLREAQAFNNKAQGLMASGKKVGSIYGWSDPQMLQAIQPGAIYAAPTEPEPKKLLIQPTYLDAAKKLLGIK